MIQQTKKLRLEELQVDSFITNIQNLRITNVVGGDHNSCLESNYAPKAACLTYISASPDDPCHPCYTHYCTNNTCPPPDDTGTQCSYVACVTVVVGCPTMAQTPIPCYV